MSYFYLEIRCDEVSNQSRPLASRGNVFESYRAYIKTKVSNQSRPLASRGVPILAPLPCLLSISSLRGLSKKQQKS